jgi:hypothetical protein
MLLAVKNIHCLLIGAKIGIFEDVGEKGLLRQPLLKSQCSGFLYFTFLNAHFLPPFPRTFGV